MSTEQKLVEFIESLAAEGVDRDALGDLHAEVIGRINRLRRDRDRAIRDMEAAKLLPSHGPDAVAARLGVCRRSVYYMAGRAKRGSASNGVTVAQIA